MIRRLNHVPRAACALHPVNETSTMQPLVFAHLFTNTSNAVLKREAVPMEPGEAPPSRGFWDGEKWVETGEDELRKVLMPSVGIGGKHGFNVNRWMIQREQEALRNVVDEVQAEAIEQPIRRTRARL